MAVAPLIDDSQAAMPAIQMIREAVDSFIKALDGKAEIALITFGDGPRSAPTTRTRRSCWRAPIVFRDRAPGRTCSTRSAR